MALLGCDVIYADYFLVFRAKFDIRMHMRTSKFKTEYLVPIW